MNEHRRFSRIPFEAETRLEAAGQPQAARLIDLSLKGALLEMEQEPTPAMGTPVLLEIRLLGEEACVRMEGEVAHREGSRLGLRCVSIDLDSIAHLRRLLELNSGDPGRVERELSALI